MEELVNFLNNILKNIGQNNINEISMEQARKVINEINNFLYTGYEEMEEISEYHKFWKKNCEKILDPKINEEKCKQVADIFHAIYRKNKSVFYSLYSKEHLTDEEVCKIRFYTATQDFYGSRKFSDYAEIYKKDNNVFDKQYILSNSGRFLNDLKLINLSQNDKRKKYAQKSAEFLRELDCEPYDLLEKFDYDVINLKEALVNHVGMGFGNKKADMFIRDMVVLKIWKKYKNFDRLNVASDRNTMKIAFRSGILTTEIPLMTSFLDIFSYQYGLIDQWNVKAWRKVWECWKQKYPNECIEGPCLIDYLVYRIIGKEFCNETLAIYQCKEQEHTFKWHTTRQKKCHICLENNKNNEAKVIKKILPCQDEEGSICITKSEYVSGDHAVLNWITECPLKEVCHPTSENFVKYNEPKSISILGKTGWERARVNKNEGGGGLMS